jgi:hypothetical protein
MDQPKLLWRAVVGVVARQNHKIDPAPRMAIDVVDDAAQIEVILQNRFGQMQISDMQECQRSLVGRSGHGGVLGGLVRDNAKAAPPRCDR